jgi:threonine/homoserine/homoserine lactone efflux protein
VSSPGTLAAFFALELTLCAIPGPAVLFTTLTTMRRGVAGGLAAVAGIVAGNTAYFVLSGVGVAALLLASYRAFAVVKVAGALYLASLGLRALFARGDGDDGHAGAPSRSASTERTGDRGRAFFGALATQLANPKAIVFFVAIVPQFVDPRGTLPVQIAAFALLSMAAETLVLCCYVALAARVRRSDGAARARIWIERAGGAILLASAAAVAREPFVPAP